MSPCNVRKVFFFVGTKHVNFQSVSFLNCAVLRKGVYMCVFVKTMKRVYNQLFLFYRASTQMKPHVEATHLTIFNLLNNFIKRVTMCPDRGKLVPQLLHLVPAVLQKHSVQQLARVPAMQLLLRQHVRVQVRCAVVALGQLAVTDVAPIRAAALAADVVTAGEIFATSALACGAFK